MTEEQKQQILEYYCGNQNHWLENFAKPMFNKFGGITQKDYDDFYSLAGLTLSNVIDTYDPDNENGVTFEQFFASCLKSKFKSQMSLINASRRGGEGNGTVKKQKIETVSIYAPINDDADSPTLLDCISKTMSNGDDVESNVKCLNGFSDNVQAFWDRCNKKEKQLLQLKMDGYSSNEIMEIMGINSKTYYAMTDELKSYERTKDLKNKTIIVKENNNLKEIEEVDIMSVREVVRSHSSYKMENILVSSLVKQIANYVLRGNHPLQRTAGQWDDYKMSELISDILQGRALLPIIISDETVDGFTKQWIIDGLQRTSTICSFVNDGFSISKKVQISDIPYQTFKKDEDGNLITTEDGFPIPEICTFNIKGKKFSQLPEELKDRLLDYQLPVLRNLDCTKEDIAYDIARFNRCRPMNTAQADWTEMDENFAELIQKIVDLPFFDGGNETSMFTKTQKTNSSLRRIIVETLMLINFESEYKTDYKPMVHYISDNANDRMITDLYSAIDTLYELVDERTKTLFNGNNTSCFLTSYMKCKHKDKFMDFLLWFIETGKNDVTVMFKFKDKTDINNVKSLEADKNFAFINANEDGKSTKSKYFVFKKLECINKAMNQFFGDDNKSSSENNDIEIEYEISNETNNEVVEVNNTQNEITTNVPEDFKNAAIVSEINVTDVNETFNKCIDMIDDNTLTKEEKIEDVCVYMDELDNWTKDLDVADIEFFCEENLPILIKAVSNAYKHDYDEDFCISWLEQISGKDSENLENIITEMDRYMSVFTNTEVA